MRTICNLLTFLVVVERAISSPDSLSNNQQHEYECSPKGIHIAQAADVSSFGRVGMTVSFLVDRACSNHTRPIVYYGQEMDEDEHFTASPDDTFRPSRLSFTYTNMEINVTSYESDWIYHILLPNLKAETQYWYEVSFTLLKTPDMHLRRRVSEETRSSRHISTKRLEFKTPPLPGSPVSFAIVGDVGNFDRSLHTMQNIRMDGDSSQIILAGDLSYANGVGEEWVRWLESMEPIFSEIPIAVAAGNHEVECDTSNLSSFTFYETLFHNPNRIQEAIRNPMTKEYKESLRLQACNAPPTIEVDYQYGNSFYAYEFGLLKVVVLNSYVDCTPGSIQHHWLVNTLSSIDRSITPWVMVVTHNPLYDTFTGHQNERHRNTKALKNLFVEHHVDLVVGGHDHAYMRTHPIIHGQVDAGGPVYIVVGVGGSNEGPPERGFHHMDPEPWIATRRLDTSGYGHITVHNATHAYWDYRANPETEVWNWSMKYYTEDTEQNQIDRAARGLDVGGYMDGSRFRDSAWLTRMN
jgi:hypothetical protein